MCIYRPQASAARQPSIRAVGAVRLLFRLQTAWVFNGVLLSISPVVRRPAAIGSPPSTGTCGLLLAFKCCLWRAQARAASYRYRRNRESRVATPDFMSL